MSWLRIDASEGIIGTIALPLNWGGVLFVLSIFHDLDIHRWNLTFELSEPECLLILKILDPIAQIMQGRFMTDDIRIDRIHAQHADAACEAGNQERHGRGIDH